MRRNILLVVLLSLISLFVFWGPFLLKVNSGMGIYFGKKGMETIVQNFDGLNFLVVAKSWYNPRIIEEVNAQFLTGNEPRYFTAHFPLFAGLIKLFGAVLSLPQGLLAAIIVSNILLAVGLYWFFLQVFAKRNLAFVLTAVALFFPARMLSVRVVGSNEPLFMFLILCSLTFSMKKQYWPSAITGALAVLTRSPGILLFGVYLWQLVVNKEQWTSKMKRFLPYLVMPTALLGLFLYYDLQFQDPLAYFHSGDNLHLFLQPFQIFSNQQSWISDMWREDIIYLYLFYGVGIFMIKEKWTVVKQFGWLYGLMLLFVAHRDLARYALPLSPIALLGYAPLIEKIPRKVWWGAMILLIPIYLLGWQFVLKNIQPISDWTGLI